MVTAYTRASTKSILRTKVRYAGRWHRPSKTGVQSQPVSVQRRSTAQPPLLLPLSPIRLRALPPTLVPTLVLAQPLTP